MSTILVTGGAGFIGSWLVRSLLERDHTVVVVDDYSGTKGDHLASFQSSYSDSVLRVFKMSCGQRHGMQLLCERYAVDTVVHCAANARESASQFQPSIVTDRNLGAYAATLSAAISAGVKNVLCFSTLAVYGDGGAYHPPFGENLDTCPEDVYGINKEAMEKMTRVLCGLHGVNWAIVRPHNVFGEWQSLSDPYRNVVGIFLNKIMRREPLVLFNEGKNVRAFSYIQDCIPPMIRLIENIADPKLNGRIFNIGGNAPITVRELAERAIETMRDLSTCAMLSPYPLELAAARPLEVAEAYTCHERAVELLGFVEKFGWSAGVLFMAAWAMEQGPQAWSTFDGIEIDSPLIPQAWRAMDQMLAVKRTPE